MRRRGCVRLSVLAGLYGELQYRGLARRPAVGAHRQRCEVHLDPMRTRIGCADENGILILSQITRTAVDHAREDPSYGSGWKYLDDSTVLIVLTVGPQHLNGERASPGCLHLIDVGRALDCFRVYDVDLRVAVKISEGYAAIPAARNLR